MTASPPDSRASLKGYEWLKDTLTDPGASGEGESNWSRSQRTWACSLAQMALAWCLKNPNVSTVITGASRVEQVQENMKALEAFEKLTPGVIDAHRRDAGHQAGNGRIRKQKGKQKNGAWNSMRRLAFRDVYEAGGSGSLGGSTSVGGTSGAAFGFFVRRVSTPTTTGTAIKITDMHGRRMSSQVAIGCWVGMTVSIRYSERNLRNVHSTKDTGNNSRTTTDQAGGYRCNDGTGFLGFLFHDIYLYRICFCQYTFDRRLTQAFWEEVHQALLIKPVVLRSVATNIAHFTKKMSTLRSAHRDILPVLLDTQLLNAAPSSNSRRLRMRARIPATSLSARVLSMAW